jgi:SepF-like predicted cell division protein (DUF552 family)
MHDLKSRHDKLLDDAADCELIANLASDPKKRETFSRLAKDLKQLAQDLNAEIARRELAADH